MAQTEMKKSGNASQIEKVREKKRKELEIHGKYSGSDVLSI